MKVANLGQPQPIEKRIASAAVPMRRKRTTVFSHDGEVEIAIYKLGDGRFCPAWRDESGERKFKPLKKEAEALKTAKEVCAQLWEVRGFGRREDCRVMLMEPARAVSRTRNRIATAAGDTGTDAPADSNMSERRIVPNRESWRFAKLPLWLLRSHLTLAQKSVYAFMSYCAWDSGICTASQRTIGRETGLSRQHVGAVMDSLVSNGLLVLLKAGSNVASSHYGFLRHALMEPEGGQLSLPPPGNCDSPAGRLSAPRLASLDSKLGQQRLPKKTSRVLQIKKDEYREKPVVVHAPEGARGSAAVPASPLLASNDEEGLLALIAKCCGLREVVTNGGNWRKRMRDKNSLRALRNALEDFAARTPEQKESIKKKGAWLNDRFSRCLKEIEAAQ